MSSPASPGPSCRSLLKVPSHGLQGLGARCRLVHCRGWVLDYTPGPSPQGSNGTFLLTVVGPDAAAFSVSPERAAGSVDVQVLVRAPELVDYETKTVMLVQVRAALGRPGAQSTGTLIPLLLLLPLSLGHGYGLSQWERLRRPGDHPP